MLTATGRVPLASFPQNRGYETIGVGKWHLRRDPEEQENRYAAARSPSIASSGHRSQELVNVPATSTRDAPAVSSNARPGGGSSAREAG